MQNCATLLTLLVRANIIHLITQRLEYGERDSAGRLGDVGRHGDDLAVALVDGGRGSRVDDCRRVVLLQGIHSHYSRITTSGGNFGAGY